MAWTESIVHTPCGQQSLISQVLCAVQQGEACCQVGWSLVRTPSPEPGCLPVLEGQREPWILKLSSRPMSIPSQSEVGSHKLGQSSLTSPGETAFLVAGVTGTYKAGAQSYRLKIVPVGW